MNSQILHTALTQYYWLPLSYNYPKLFIFCASRHFLTNTFILVAHSIKMNNQCHILRLIHNSCILYWHGIMWWHYPTIILNCSYFVHLLPFYPKKSVPVYTVLKWIINPTWFNKPCFAYCISTILWDAITLQFVDCILFISCLFHCV